MTNSTNQVWLMAKSLRQQCFCCWW